MLAGFKSANHPQQVAKRGALEDTDDRRTLPEIFDPLNDRYGPFTLDAAASSLNKKCRKFFSKEQDGLSQSWAGETVWCNPPYSDIGPWVRKALDETRDGSCRRVVLLLPANRCEQKWWQDMIEPIRDTGRLKTSFLRGRPRFGWPSEKPRPKKGDRPPFGLVVVVIESGFTGEDFRG